MSHQYDTKSVKIQGIMDYVMDKYTFINDYLSQPDVNTGAKIPFLTKTMSTVIYLRRRLEFQVDPEESFYSDIGRNDYSKFEEISDKPELYKILVCFISFALGHVNSVITTDDESRDKIINTIRKYYYKNKDFVV